MVLMVCPKIESRKVIIELEDRKLGRIQHEDPDA